VTSIQVLNEISNVLLKKFNLAGTSLDSYSISYYDSLIIAAALENECVLLLTEDLQNGQKIENTLIIKNVFD
jgi:predicted nucleic acid-binding protein